MKKFFSTFFAATASIAAFAQAHTGDPKLTELWDPVPAIVQPGKTAQDESVLYLLSKPEQPLHFLGDPFFIAFFS